MSFIASIRRTIYYWVVIVWFWRTLMMEMYKQENSMIEESVFICCLFVVFCFLHLVDAYKLPYSIGQVLLSHKMSTLFSFSSFICIDTALRFVSWIIFGYEKKVQTFQQRLWACDYGESSMLRKACHIQTEPHVLWGTLQLISPNPEWI